MTTRTTFLAGIAGALLIGMLSFVCNPELGLFLFYFFPIALVAWRSGPTKGCLLAVWSAIVWCFADYYSGRTFTSDFYLWWNAGIRLVAFLFVAVSLSTIRRLLADACSEVASLRRFLRMCAWCRKIATPDGQWISIESFFTNHTKSDVTHSICPECAKSVVSDLGRDNTEPYPDGLRQTWKECTPRVVTNAKE